MNTISIIGHRGYSKKYPENTMLAIEKCLDIDLKKYPLLGIEIDLQLTKDGQIVIFHDRTLDHLTGKEGTINDWDYADLKKLTIKHDEHVGQTIPLLKDVFDRVNHKTYLFLELKNRKFDSKIFFRTIVPRNIFLWPPKRYLYAFEFQIFDGKSLGIVSSIGNPLWVSSRG